MSKNGIHGGEDWISVIGRRRTMEEVVTAEEIGPYKLYAVHDDGHVAEACRERVRRAVEDGRRSGGAGFEWGDEEEEGFGYGLAVIVGKSVVVVVAHDSGDFRAVLCRGENGVPLYLSQNQDNGESEKERVEKKSGGSVPKWNRIIGDRGVNRNSSSKPIVRVWDRSELDGVAVIASIGLWDVMSIEFVRNIVWTYFNGEVPKKFTKSTAHEASAILAELAMARGSKYNISVVLVDLKA